MYASVYTKVAFLSTDHNVFVINQYDPRSTRQRWQKGGTRRDRIENGLEAGRFLELQSNRKGSQLSSTTFKNNDQQKWTFEHV